MFRCRPPILAAAIALAAGLLAPATAAAGFTLDVKIEGSGGVLFNGNVGDVGTANKLEYFETLHGVEFDISGRTSSPGVSAAHGGAYVLDDTTTLFNGSSGLRTVTLTFTSTGFTAPGAVGDRLRLTDYLIIDDLLGTATSVDIIGHAEAKPTTTGGTTVTDAIHFPAGVEGQNKTHYVYFDRGAYADGTYTQVNVVTVALGSGEGIGFRSKSVVTTPAPATLIMTAAGAPVFGLFGWLRRRKATRTEA